MVGGPAFRRGDSGYYSEKTSASSSPSDDSSPDSSFLRPAPQPHPLARLQHRPTHYHSALELRECHAHAPGPGQVHRWHLLTQPPPLFHPTPFAKDVSHLWWSLEKEHKGSAAWAAPPHRLQPQPQQPPQPRRQAEKENWSFGNRPVFPAPAPAPSAVEYYARLTQPVPPPRRSLSPNSLPLVERRSQAHSPQRHRRQPQPQAQAQPRQSQGESQAAQKHRLPPTPAERPSRKASVPEHALLRPAKPRPADQPRPTRPVSEGSILLRQARLRLTPAPQASQTGSNGQLHVQSQPSPPPAPTLLPAKTPKGLCPKVIHSFGQVIAEFPSHFPSIHHVWPSCSIRLGSVRPAEVLHFRSRPPKNGKGIVGRRGTVERERTGLREGEGRMMCGREKGSSVVSSFPTLTSLGSPPTSPLPLPLPPSAPFPPPGSPGEPPVWRGWRGRGPQESCVGRGGRGLSQINALRPSPAGVFGGLAW